MTIATTNHAAQKMGALMLVALLPAVVAGEYDACGRPDAVYASWDQVILSLRTPPCATIAMRRHAHAPNAHCQPYANHAAWQGHGTSYAYGAIQSGDNIYIIGRACASPSHA